MPWIVETSFGGTWENSWLDEDEKPVVFDTFEEAELELREFLADQTEAAYSGHMGDFYDPEDFRITEVLDVY